MLASVALAGGVPGNEYPAARALAVLGICPYLVGDDGCKSLSPSKRHRCEAAGELTPVTTDKQRRLCLTRRHVGCATYRAALGLDDESLAAAEEGPYLPAYPAPTTMWAFTRPTPVLLEQRRFALPGFSVRPAPNLRQASLAAVMVVAFAFLFTSRLANPDLNDGTGAVAGVQGTPAVASDRPSPRSVVAASPVGPSLSPLASRAPSGTGPGARPSSAPSAARTYTVKSGDTLYAIASRYGTTVRAMADLNDLGDGSFLKVGQKLRVP